MLNSKYLFKMFQLFMKLQKTFLCLSQNTKECAKPFSKADHKADYVQQKRLTTKLAAAASIHIEKLF